ncbi:hypothetical protein MMC07_005812 [Pseudocyphellaria aurata]|nr:hypothetical protein [Pseudocyphellaria aurata]
MVLSEWVDPFGICDPLVNGINQLAKNVLYNWARIDSRQDKIDGYNREIVKNRNLSITRRRALAAKYTQIPVFFSWDFLRTREGFFHYRAGIPAATKRAIEFAPYADLLWLETAKPIVGQEAKFASETRAAYPGKQLVYNLSPSFNWMGQGFDEASLKSFIWDLSKHG